MATATYSAEHARALSLVRQAGANVVFLRPGMRASASGAAYDPVRDQVAPGTDAQVTITGAAVRTRGNPLTYTRLGLTTAEAPSLTVVTDTPSASVEPGDMVTWGGIDYTVREVEPVAPNGVPILLRVIVTR